MVESCPGAVAQTQCLDQSGYDEIARSVGNLMNSLDTRCDAESCPQSDVLGCWVRAVGHDFMDFDSSQPFPGGADGCIDFQDHDNDGLPACIFSGDHGVSINDVYQAFCTRVSLADFIVIAAEAAMDWSRTAHGLEQFGFTQGRQTETFKTLFRYGRVTASQCDGFDGAGTSRLPNPEHGCPETERVFGQNLGLTWEESTAMMGVHVMGRAEPKNSGYKGWWVEPEQSRIFHNAYYWAILGKGWVPELDVIGQLADSPEFDIPPHLQDVASKHQWQRGDDARAELHDAAHQMMLNTDLCLAYNRGPDQQGRSEEQPGEYLAQEMSRECCSWSFSRQLRESLPENSYCNQPLGQHTIGEANGREELEMCCGMGERGEGRGGGEPFNCGTVGGSDLAPGFDSVRLFARDEQRWFQAFGAAWSKATSAGQGGLRPLEGACN